MNYRIVTRWILVGVSWVVLSCSEEQADCPACETESEADCRVPDQASTDGDDAGAQYEDVSSLPSVEQWFWPEAKVLFVTLEVDAEKAAAWLPKGMTMVEPGTAVVMIADYPNQIDCGPYHEAAIFLVVMHEEVPKLHCPWILVDNDIALILGREVMGFPKKMGEISLEVVDGELKALVKRGNATLIEASGTLGDAVQDPMPKITSCVNIWGANDVHYNNTLPASRLITFELTIENLSETEVDIDFDLQGSSGDPIDQMGVKSVVRATYEVFNMGSPNREDYAFTLLDEVDEDYQQRVYALRYGKAP